MHSYNNFKTRNILIICNKSSLLVYLANSHLSNPILNTWYYIVTSAQQWQTVVRHAEHEYSTDMANNCTLTEWFIIDECVCLSIWIMFNWACTQTHYSPRLSSSSRIVVYSTTPPQWDRKTATVALDLTTELIYPVTVLWCGAACSDTGLTRVW
jgi:hypothetical protein